MPYLLSENQCLALSTLRKSLSTLKFQDNPAVVAGMRCDCKIHRGAWGADSNAYAQLDIQKRVLHAGLSATFRVGGDLRRVGGAGCRGFIRVQPLTGGLGGLPPGKIVKMCLLSLVI